MSVKLEYTDHLAEDDLQLVSEAASAADVLAQVERMTWDDLSMVHLTNDQGVKLEASGSKMDGMSVTFTVGGKSWISKDAPTMEQAKEILRRFAEGDPDWKETFEFEFFQNEDGTAGSGSKQPGCLGAIMLMVVVGALIVSRVI